MHVVETFKVASHKFLKLWKSATDPTLLKANDIGQAELSVRASDKYSSM